MLKEQRVDLTSGRIMLPGTGRLRGGIGLLLDAQALVPMFWYL